MITQAELFELYKEVCKGDTDAFNFLVAWGKCVHGIDDIVDEDIIDTEGKVKVFLETIAMTQNPFFLKYNVSLYPVIILISNDYIDSNNPDMPFNDALRAAGNNMLFLVSFIFGGIEHMRKMTPKIRKISFKEHHGEDNKPI